MQILLYSYVYRPPLSPFVCSGFVGVVAEVVSSDSFFGGSMEDMHCSYNYSFS